MCSLMLTVLLCNFALSFFTTQAATCRRHKLKVHPSSIKAVVDEPFHITCSLKNTAHNINSSLLKFCIQQSGSSVVSVDDNFVHVVDNATIQLVYTLDQPTENTRRTFVMCFVKNDPDVTCNHSCSKKSSIVIGYRPFLPNILEHFVSNWQQLHIVWEFRENPVYHTTYRSWIQMKDSQEFKLCSSPPAECIFEDPFTQANEYGNLIVKVNASNIVGEKSNELTIHLHDIVRPGPVHDLTVFTNASDVYATFNSPKPGKYLKYNVSAFCAEDGLYKVMHVSNESALMVPVRNIPPYCNCILSVSGKPLHHGYWGPVTTSDMFQTWQTVPNAVPEICTSCFKLSHVNASRTVILYFKPLLRSQARGRVVAYRVNITCDTYSEEEEIPAVAEMMSVKLDLPVNSACVVHMDAGTEPGFNNTLQPSTVMIPSRCSEQENVQNFTVIAVNKTYVQLFWRADGKAQHYTVFWCRHSKVNMQWMTLYGNVSQYCIVLPSAEDSDNYMFGIASQSLLNWTCGISFTRCLYHATANILPVQIDRIVNVSSSSVMIHLKSQKCVQTSAYVFEHRIHCCIDGSCTIVKVVNSSTSDILVDGLASGSRYHVYVESVSLSGSASSASMPFWTQRQSVYHKTFQVLVLAFVIIIALSATVFLLFLCSCSSECDRKGLWNAVYQFWRCLSYEKIVPPPVERGGNDNDADRRNITYSNPTYDATGRTQNSKVLVRQLNPVFTPQPTAEGESSDESSGLLLDNSGPTHTSCTARVAPISSVLDQSQGTSAGVSSSSSTGYRPCGSRVDGFQLPSGPPASCRSLCADEISVHSSLRSASPVTSQSDVDSCSRPLSPDSTVDYAVAAENISTGSGGYQRGGSHIKSFGSVCFDTPPADLAPKTGHELCSGDCAEDAASSNCQNLDKVDSKFSLSCTDDPYCTARGQNSSENLFTRSSDLPSLYMTSAAVVESADNSGKDPMTYGCQCLTAKVESVSGHDPESGETESQCSNDCSTEPEYARASVTHNNFPVHSRGSPAPLSTDNDVSPRIIL